MNPELRQTLQTLSRNIESANETAQENIYTFSSNYVDPCFASIKSCFTSCVEPCFPTADSRKRRRRRKSHGRPEQSFDFYDDWDDEFGDNAGQESDALLGWGNDRLDRLLAGSQSTQDNRKRGVNNNQPRRQRAMSYGTKGRRAGLPQDHGPDPTVIPGSAYLGFLERLPWRIGRRGLRYKPSAADLQEHPGGDYFFQDEIQPLVESSEDEGIRPPATKVSGRKRSGTTGSQSTTNSLSSRGDLIPSEDELEADAVPLDDEFAVALERRNTGLTISGDDRSSGKIRSGKRPSASRASIRSVSNRSLVSAATRSQRSASKRSEAESDLQESQELVMPTLNDLKREEDEAREEEEAEINRQRQAAINLAEEQGLLRDAKEVHLDNPRSDPVVSTMEDEQDPAHDESAISTEGDQQFVEEQSQGTAPPEEEDNIAEPEGTDAEQG